MKTKNLQIFITIFYIFFTFNCGSLYLTISGEDEKESNSLFSLLVSMALKGDVAEGELSSETGGGDTFPTSIEPTEPATQTEISPITQVYVDSIKSGKYELDSYSAVSISFRTFSDDSSIEIEERDRVFLKMKEIQFISTIGEKIQVDTYINNINLLMGRNSKVKLIKKTSIPQGTYSKAIIVCKPLV